jgi:endonuclease/exonuclease/phosphatase family metal-dependent hydrolase
MRVTAMEIQEPLCVMTFNVRQMDGEDGAQSWEYRKDLLAETILLHRPALLGTQEIFPEQTAFLLERIPEFDCFGRGRFGDDRDKHNKIFFDRRRFSLVDCGEMWFSRTPEIAGSNDWEIPRPRMVTWGRLRQSDGQEILALNTHLPYGRNAAEARRESALVVLQQIAALPSHLPLFLTGDFNSPADGEIHGLLTCALDDAWKTAPETSGPESTVHGFGRVTGRRIDWILHRNAGRTLQAETVTHTADGLYPSDHYPVTATFQLDTVP